MEGRLENLFYVGNNLFNGEETGSGWTTGEVVGGFG